MPTKLIRKSVDGDQVKTTVEVDADTNAREVDLHDILVAGLASGSFDATLEAQIAALIAVLPTS